MNVKETQSMDELLSSIKKYALLDKQGNYVDYSCESDSLIMFSLNAAFRSSVVIAHSRDSESDVMDYLAGALAFPFSFTYHLVVGPFKYDVHRAVKDGLVDITYLNDNLK